MVLLAAFQALLHRLTGEDDLVVGSPIANRTHAGLEGLIGFFVNTLALRSRLDSDPPFRRLLAIARSTALGAYAHQDLPFERLVEELRVERSLRHAPVFQVMLTLQNAPMAELALPGLTLSPVALAPGEAKFDLSLTFLENGRASLEYDARLFDPSTAERLLERLGVLLDGIARDPDCPLSELPVMGEAERRQILEWSAPRAVPPGTPVHRRFEEWAARAPEAPAVGGLTYGELDLAANRLARDLRAAGAGIEIRVAVSTSRPEGWPLAFFAVLKAGAVYVPLDPRLPAERRDLLLADSGASILLADEALLGQAGGLRAVCLDRVSRFGPETFPAVEVPPEALAYVIYTSGSTGVPKGVGVPVGAFARHMADLARRFGLGPGDRLLGAHADGFDSSLENMTALMSGAALFPRGGALWTASELADRIERWGITVAQMPTTYWRQLVADLAASGRTLPAHLRLVDAGGEAMPAEVARLWRRVAPATRLINGYGPTETLITPTIYEAAGEIPDTPSGSVPIGRPVGGRIVRVMDRQSRPVPIGVAGELWVGELLARGYLGRPDATAAAFVPHDRGQRLYRTGDRVRRLADGNLEYLGRLDRQVKVRGYRIEPAEVEAALLRDPAVREAAVIAAGTDGERLVAFLVPRSEPVHPDLTLPAYMIPSAYVWLDALPLTATGKVDRRALSRLEVRSDSGSVPPRDHLERELAAIWEDLLGVRPVGARDDFFALGGHSLLAVRLASRVEARFGRRMPIATLFERRTVEGLAAWLRPSLARSSSPLVRIQPKGSRPPLFLVHPGGGGVLCYAELARALGPDQPLYGLQAPGLDGERPPLDSIGEMADLYLEAIREAQPEGPWHLGGWSFGGLVAYEMACRLGDRAGLVAILDVPARKESAADEAEILLRTLDRELPLTAEELRGLDTRAQVALVLERMPGLPPDFDERRAVALVEVFKANLRAARAWEPSPYPGKVTVFRAAAGDRVGRDGGWEALAKALEVVTVPGDHHSMVEPPHVEALARALREAL
jgi:amino acid adenylation domain-containing protein